MEFDGHRDFWLPGWGVSFDHETADTLPRLVRLDRHGSIAGDLSAPDDTHLRACAKMRAPAPVFSRRPLRPVMKITAARDSFEMSCSAKTLLALLAPTFCAPRAGTPVGHPCKREGGGAAALGFICPRRLQNQLGAWWLKRKSGSPMM